MKMKIVENRQEQNEYRYSEEISLPVNGWIYRSHYEDSLMLEKGLTDFWIEFLVSPCLVHIRQPEDPDYAFITVRTDNHYVVSQPSMINCPQLLLLEDSSLWSDMPATLTVYAIPWERITDMNLNNWIKQREMKTVVNRVSDFGT